MGIYRDILAVCVCVDRVWGGYGEEPRHKMQLADEESNGDSNGQEKGTCVDIGDYFIP